jgi:GT2 family glycosyltransferase
VAVIDVACALSDLDCTRDAPPPYAGAWILACRAGLPLGSVQIPLRGTRVAANDLERELHKRFGGVWARERQDDAPALASASVVVCTNFARPVLLHRCLESLAALDYPDYEVIVVDNRPAGSPAEDLARTMVVREPRPGASAARNRGLAVARGEIVAFTDDDVEVDPGWLRALGERLGRQPDVAAVTGLAVPRELETPAQIWFEESRRLSDRSFLPLAFFLGGRFWVVHRSIEDGSERLVSLYAMGERGGSWNIAFRATALRGMGGFDEALGIGTPACGGEDLALIVELLTSGHCVGYEPSAVVYHTHRATLAELQRQMHGYGVGFTAMLTAITLRNPWHLVGMAMVVPAWVRSLVNPASAQHAARTPTYPRALVRTELRGMLAGPFAYMRSRRMQRRWPDERAEPIDHVVRHQRRAQPARDQRQAPLVRRGAVGLPLVLSVAAAAIEGVQLLSWCLRRATRARWERRARN